MPWLVIQYIFLSMKTSFSARLSVPNIPSCAVYRRFRWCPSSVALALDPVPHRCGLLSYRQLRASWLGLLFPVCDFFDPSAFIFLCFRLINPSIDRYSTQQQAPPARHRPPPRRRTAAASTDRHFIAVTVATATTTTLRIAGLLWEMWNIPTTYGQDCRLLLRRIHDQSQGQ
jgi:hypothetical protein